MAKSYDISFSSGSQRFVLKTARPAEDAPSTAAAEFEIVWVNEGTAADFVGRDVRGKAVLIQSIPTPGVLRQSINYEGAVERAVKAGAAAIGMMYGISDNFALWELRTAGQAWFLRRLRGRPRDSRSHRSRRHGTRAHRAAG